MSVVTDLEKSLVKLNSTTYDSVDKLMKKVAKDNDISATELHHKFKSKHNMIPDDWIKIQMQEGNLHKWFKGSKSKDGKSGWVNVVTGGTCASDKPGEGTPKCVSSSKRASMTPAERKSAQRRKKDADPNQQSKSGAAKPTYVSTDPKKKMKESKEHPKNVKGIAKELDKAVEMHKSQAKRLRKAGISEGSDKKGKGSGTKDACYHKVKSRYSVWPSAYASGALVKCRKVGAANWGNKSEGFTPSQIKALEEIGAIEINEAGQKCWKGYEKKGTKMMFGKRYNNCVKKEEVEEIQGIEEAVRIPAKNGNIIMVNLGWKGKYYSIKMFFPQINKPSRKDVQDQIEKVYPGAKLYTFVVSNYEPGEPMLHTEGAAWTKKEGKNKEGGLNEKGRKSYEKENPGSDLKAPSKKVGNPRRASFCARMKGMKKKLTSKKTASDPDSRINKSLRAWNC